MNSDDFPRLRSSHSLLLPSDEVHTWYASLDLSPQRLQRLASLLSPDEQARAERFYFERDRKRFIAGRGLLRTILGSYLGMEPSRVEFCYGSYGKPALKTTFYGRVLQFSLSHSNGLALYTVSWNRRVGVDVEYIRPVCEADRIAERFFSADETAVIRSLPVERRLEAFFNAWTRKEAYLKAIGDGLTRPLTQIEVSLAPGEPARLVSVRGDRWEATRWRLEALKVASGYLTALAVEGHGWHLIVEKLD